MSSSAIQAGRAFVALYVDRAELTEGLAEGAAEVGNWSEKVRAAVQKVGVASAATGTVMLGALVPALNAASDQAESLAAFEQVFLGANEEAERLAQTLSQKVGRSTIGISAAMTPIGAMVTGMGLASDEAARLSANAAAAGLDISAFFNTSAEETFARLRSALSGSSEAVDQFGINLRKEALDKKLAELGYAGSELEKTLARMAIIQESLANSGAAGAAEREKESWANLSRAMGDATRDLMGAAGEAIKPVSELLLGVLVRGTQAAAGWLREAPLVVQSFAGIAAAAAAGGAGLAVFASQTAHTIANVTIATAGVIRFTTWLIQSGNGAKAAAIGLSVYQAASTRLSVVTGGLGRVMGLIPGKGLIVKAILAAMGFVTWTVVAAFAALAAIAVGVGAWLAAIHQRTGALQPLFDALASVGRTLSAVWNQELVPVLQKLQTLFSGLFEGQADTWSGPIEMLASALGGALVVAAETAAGAIALVAQGVQWVIDNLNWLLGLDTSSTGPKPEKGGPAGKEKPEKDPDAADKAQKEQEEKEDLQKWADRVKDEVMTPAETLAETIKKLDKALAEGMIDQETYKRKREKAEKDKVGEEQAAFDSSLAGKKAKELQQFADKLVEDTQTPLETFQKTMQAIDQALQAGTLTAEVARRGQDAAKKALDDEQAKVEAAAKEAAEKSRKDLLDETKKVADQRLTAARALGGDRGAKAELDALKRNFADFSKNGFKDEALATQLDFLKGVIERSEDIDQEVKSQQGSASQQTFSAQEALAGLGTKTIDEQLLAEQKIAKAEAIKARECLEKIVAQLDG